MVHIGKCCTCGKMTRHQLLILGKLICRDCEDKIVHIDVEDTNYQEFKQGLKRLFTELSMNCFDRNFI